MKIFAITTIELQRKQTKIEMCPAAMQNAYTHTPQGAEGTAVRSSTFLFKNASQTTNTVLEAQSYSTFSQSPMPAQPSTLKSTCKAKLASVALQLMLSSPSAGTELTVSLPQRERQFRAQAKAGPYSCPSSDCRALLGFSLSTTACYRRGEKNGPSLILKEAKTSHFEGAGGIKDV